MKLSLSLTVAIMLAGSAFAHPIRTNVLVAGDPPLTIEVRDARVRTVLNFFSNGAGIGNISVSKDGKNTQILYALDISATDGQRPNLVVAGPATVTITVGSQPLMVSYRVDANE